MYPVVCKVFFIRHHQLHLTDRAQSLLIVDITSPAPLVDRADTAYPCSRRNQDHLFSHADQIVYLLRYVVEDFFIHHSIFVREHIAADFDDYLFTVFNRFFDLFHSFFSPPACYKLYNICQKR